MDFDSLEQFAGFLQTSAIAGAMSGGQSGLKKAAELVEKTAKAEFGVYQPEVSPFPAWAELAPSTKEDRVSKGFTENDPLLRTGATRDSISHEVGDGEAVIGSDSDIMVYHEFGTPGMPPRPVLGPAVIVNKDKIRKLIGGAVVTGMVSGDHDVDLSKHSIEV